MRMLVNIDAPEIASAVAFYHAALGLELMRMLSDDVAELAGCYGNDLSAAQR